MCLQAMTLRCNAAGSMARWCHFFQFNIPPNHIPLGSILFITHPFIHFRYDIMQEVRKSCHFMTWYNIRMSILLGLSIFIYENGQEKISTYPKTLLITWMMAEYREFKVKLLFWVVHSYKKGTIPNFQHRFRFWKPVPFSTIEYVSSNKNAIGQSSFVW